MDHLSEQEMSDFLEGRLEPPSVRRLVDHLLTQCGTCHLRLLAAGLPEPLFRERERPPEDAYDAAIDRARRNVRKLLPRLIRDRERRDLGVKLLEEKKGEWMQLTWPELRSFRFVIPHIEVLLQRSIGHRHSNPRQMLEDAKNAQYVADKGEATQYGEALLLDLRARTWAELGNARRVNEMYQEAEAAFEQARHLLEQGTGDLFIQARIDDLEASLRRAQRRFDEALKLLDSVYRTQRKLGQEHLAARALMSKGNCLTYAGRPKEAVRAHREALAQLDETRDPTLVAIAKQSLLNSLVDAREFVEAGDFLLRSGLRKSFAGDPLNEIRLRWVEAKIMAGRGRLAESERVFADVRSGFREHNLHYDAALAGMDLAVVLLKRKKSAQALFREMTNEALAKGLHREALLGLGSFDLLYRVKPQEITLRRVERLRNFLNDLQQQPRLTFVPERFFGAYG
jgi:tetratricopeptide (TPR) repeat protein